MGAILSQFHPATALVREICPHMILLCACLSSKKPLL